MAEGKRGGLSERLGADRQTRMEKETVSPLPRDHREHGIISGEADPNSGRAVV